MLKVQHLVSVAAKPASSVNIDSAGYQQQPSRIAYIEFFVKPEEELEDDDDDDSNNNQT